MEAIGRFSGAQETKSVVWLRLDPKWVAIGIIGVIVAGFALVPLVFLLWQSFMTLQTTAKPAIFTYDNYRDSYASRETIKLFANSVEFAGGAAVLALAVGMARAWINERANMPLKSLVYALPVGRVRSCFIVRARKWYQW